MPQSRTHEPAILVGVILIEGTYNGLVKTVPGLEDLLEDGDDNPLEDHIDQQQKEVNDEEAPVREVQLAQHPGDLRTEPTDETDQCIQQ